MSVLEISQIIYNFIVSLAVLVVAILISLVAYNAIKFTRLVKKFAEGVNRESVELYEKINKFLENISNLSFISGFFKRKKK